MWSVPNSVYGRDLTKWTYKRKKCTTFYRLVWTVKRCRFFHSMAISAFRYRNCLMKKHLLIKYFNHNLYIPLKLSCHTLKYLSLYKKIHLRCTQLSYQTAKFSLQTHSSFLQYVSMVPQSSFERQCPCNAEPKKYKSSITNWTLFWNTRIFIYSG